MKVLIIGGGGREHALAWKVAQSGKVERVFVAPGNAGTDLEPNIQNVDIKAGAIDELLLFVKEQNIDLTIVGPEAPLVAGVVDVFQKSGLACFGPSAAAAQLEGSKAFSKDFLARWNIPTARYASFTDLDEAVAYVREQGAPIVIEADGLAAGKGVILAETEAQAIAAVEDMLAGSTFGDAGSRVVIEEMLQGEEASFICMVDGEHVLPMASSQDHKARDDGDTGPNTGGMGAYSPAPVVDAAMHERIMEQVILPTVKGMAADGMPYTGFLYAGVMIGDDGVPKVLEFNCRFGDPETQPIMLRLRSDLAELCQAALQGRLNEFSVEWDPRPSLGVVMAAGGYPEHYETGRPIQGLETELPDTKVFHAGTSRANGEIATSGGRVLCACALGDTVTDAQRRAYELVDRISWEDMYCRRDIGYRAAAREAASKA